MEPDINHQLVKSETTTKEQQSNYYIQSDASSFYHQPPSELNNNQTNQSSCDLANVNVEMFENMTDYSTESNNNNLTSKRSTKKGRKSKSSRSSRSGVGGTHSGGNNSGKMVSSIKMDMKAKLERSRQSARECRARKKLRYQYLDELVAKRENANLILKNELNRIKEVASMFTSGCSQKEIESKLNADKAERLSH